MVWAQYNLSDDPANAMVQATTNRMIDPVVMQDAGKGQVEIPDDTPMPCTIDTTKQPPVITPFAG